jgi:isocitrate/isopropylmalate dehydrogenase
VFDGVFELANNLKHKKIFSIKKNNVITFTFQHSNDEVVGSSNFDQFPVWV